MAKITPGNQPAFLETRPNYESVVCAHKTSFLDNDTTISLILPYFNLKQLVHAEIINHRFRNNIIKFYLRVENIKFYFSMENFSFTPCQRQQIRVQGFIDKICNHSPNIKRLEVGRSLHEMKPLSKLNLMTKLHSILVDCLCPEIEFQPILIFLKSIAHQLRVLDLSSSYFSDFSENYITNGHFLDDFVLLEELRLGEDWHLPNVTLPKLLILQYFYEPNKQNLLLQFCQKNFQIEKLYIDAEHLHMHVVGDNLQFPSSSLAFLHNLHVLHICGNFAIYGDLGKQFVYYSLNLADLRLQFCTFTSDDALQMIYDALRQSLVKFELSHFIVNSAKAVRGIHKLQNLQHLKIYYSKLLIEAEEDDGISIDDLLSLKALRFLGIYGFPIAFGATSMCKFQSLDELVCNGKTEHIRLLDYCTNSLTKLTISGLPKNANERFIQWSNDFPNLISLCIGADGNTILFEETARVMSHNLANLKHLNAPYVFSLTSLVLFFQNCKCLTNITTDSNKIDDLKNYPLVKNAQNCGRYIEIN